MRFSQTNSTEDVSERSNKTMLDMVRSMMTFAGLPTYFLKTYPQNQLFTLNKILSTIVDKTPRDIWHGKVPSLSFQKIWMYETYVKSLLRDKFVPNLHKCFFIGYPTENKVFVARDCAFL